MSTDSESFSERAFYLAEFRNRSIGIAWPADEPVESEGLARLVAELTANRTRVVLISPRESTLRSISQEASVDLADEDHVPRLWRILRRHGCAGLRVSERDFAADCRRATLELRLAKLVWVDSTPPVVRGAEGARVSVVDLAHLHELLADGSTSSGDGLRAQPARREMLEAIRGMIEGGVPAVNVCAGPDLGKELLTYAGAGTFFTRNRYAEVRPLALDDLDPAHDLIVRGEADGYLMPRDAAARDRILAHAVGLFIEGRYLAGLGALLPHPEERAVEVACLYALTRYAGEGVGAQILAHAIEQARGEGLAYLFCCTTSERVERFFERSGLRVVGPDEVPKSKWQGYDAERRRRVRCLRIDL